MAERKGILFVVSGPSGVGKGTLKDRLLSRPMGIKYSVSATTRPAREGEVDGEHYFFISEPRFKEMIATDGFLEWAFVYNHYYGTPRDFVLDNLDNGHDVLLEIDIQGAQQIKRKYPEGVFIFIAPPSIMELAQRLEKRGKDSPASIKNRLSHYDEEMAHIANYDYVVVNDDLEYAANKLSAVVLAERCKVVRFIRRDEIGTAFYQQIDESK